MGGSRGDGRKGRPSQHRQRGREPPDFAKGRACRRAGGVCLASEVRERRTAHYAARISRLIPVKVSAAEAEAWVKIGRSCEHGTVCFPPDCVAKLDEAQLTRNYRIETSKFLNQHCALGSDLESMLLAQALKIVLQHNPPRSSRKCRARHFAFVRERHKLSNKKPISIAAESQTPLPFRGAACQRIFWLSPE